MEGEGAKEIIKIVAGAEVRTERVSGSDGRIEGAEGRTGADHHTGRDVKFSLAIISSPFLCLAFSSRMIE